MADSNQVPTEQDPPPPNSGFPPGSGTALAGYILYLTGFIFPICFVIAPIVALVGRDGSPDWIVTHHRFQLQTVLRGILLFIVIVFILPILTPFVLAGTMLMWTYFSAPFLLFAFFFFIVWLIARMVKGMLYLKRGEPHPRPTAWMFG